PASIDLRTTLFDLALQAGDATAMEQVVKELRGLEGESGTSWRYGQARLNVWQATAGGTRKGPPDTQGRQLLAHARAILPPVPERPAMTGRTALALGQIEDLLDHPDLALKGYLDAFDSGVRNPTVLRRAAELLYEQRRYADAEQMLQRLRLRDPLLTDPASQ